MKTILLQAEGGSSIQGFILPVAMILIFYMFFIRPQQKKAKEQKNFINEMKKGDNVVTMGGIHGKILEITDTTITIDVDRGTKLTVEKSSISLESSRRMNGKA
jgi:preprotein translocase subunit YajC